MGIVEGQGICVEVSGQSVRVGSLSLLFVSQGSSLGHQSWGQAPLPSKPPCLPPAFLKKSHFFKVIFRLGAFTAFNPDADLPLQKIGYLFKV